MANGTFYSALVRLYHASFNRESDMGGVGYWTSQLANGALTFAEVADQFMKSDEFTSLYGDDVSNEEFVYLLYSNVLKREPDEDGLAYWLDTLENGTLRRDILLSFSDSDEHVETIESEYGDELLSAEQTELEQISSDDSDDDSDDDSHNHSDEDSLTLLYDAAFNRSPDNEGLGYWISELAKSDISINDIANLFIQSEEFQELYGEEVSDDDFIESLYVNTLDRASDAGGKAYWFGQLASGMARHELLISFSESEEHANIVLTGTPDITDATII